MFLRVWLSAMEVNAFVFVSHTFKINAFSVSTTKHRFTQVPLERPELQERPEQNFLMPPSRVFPLARCLRRTRVTELWGHLRSVEEIGKSAPGNWGMRRFPHFIRVSRDAPFLSVTTPAQGQDDHPSPPPFQRAPALSKAAQTVVSSEPSESHRPI